MDSIAIGQMWPRTGLIGSRLVHPEPFRMVHGFNHFDSVCDFCISCALKVLGVEGAGDFVLRNLLHYSFESDALTVRV